MQKVFQTGELLLMLSVKMYDNGQTIYRVLAVRDDSVLIIDCVKRNMPVWIAREKLSEWQEIEEQALHDKTGIYPVTEDTLSKTALASAHKRYSMIACIVPLIADKMCRNSMIIWIFNEYGISKQTVRKYLCLYLAYMTVSILAPNNLNNELALSTDQKNMRWALNKFYYTQR